MTMKVDLTPEQEKRLAAQARKNGAPVEDYLQTLVQKDIAEAAQAVPPAKYDREALLTLLEELETTDKYGTADEQRETLEYLRTALDADRPGQRRIFGKGNNPA